jgi:serine/threonine-protein kinase
MQIEVLGERYELLDPIGRGGMATIYRGHDTRMDRTVAIKVLREVYSTDPKFVTRFQREAKAASALQHPNIVQVYDYGQTDGNYFIVMELVEGTDLRRYLRSRGVLDIDRAIIIAHDIALGLGAAHRRAIVHRDVKPQNIMVGKGGTIKLTDFGIASVYKDINAERLTTTGMTLGTVQYYAPEQAQGEIVSPAADVYALGIVMYEMLTGRTPFDGDTPVAVAMQHIQDTPVPPSELNPGIPQALEDIIMRCLEKIPEMRFRDGSQLARALETLGEADASEMATNQFLVSQLHPAEPITFNDMPARPGNARGAPVATSSPNQGLGSTTSPGAMTAYNNQSPQAGQMGYTPYGMMAADSGTTRPFFPGEQEEGRGGRVAGVITALIILATVLLLGFSVYLAAYLGFVNLPFVNTAANNGGTTQTTVSVKTVPSLIGLSWTQASSAAQAAGFVLKSSNGKTDGTVINQTPQSKSQITAGSTITVTMGVGATATPIIIPDELVGQPLDNVQATLTTLGLTVAVKSYGNSANYGSNIVGKVDPASGASVTAGSTVTVWVYNYTNGSPAPTPTATTNTAATAAANATANAVAQATANAAAAAATAAANNANATATANAAAGANATGTANAATATATTTPVVP